MVVASVDSSLAQHILPRLWPLPPRGFLQRGLFQCNNLGIEKHYFMHLVSKRAPSPLWPYTLRSILAMLAMPPPCIHDAQTEWLFSAFTPLPGRTRPLPPPQPVSHSVCSALGEAEGNANGSRGAESEAEKSHSVCASWNTVAASPASPALHGVYITALGLSPFRE